MSLTRIAIMLLLGLSAASSKGLAARSKARSRGADTISAGSEELRRIAYFVGDWDVVSLSGTFRIQVRPAMAERVVQSTFGTLDAQGTFNPTGVTVRTYDDESGVYRNLWYDQSLDFITEFEGRVEGGRFLFDGRGHRGKRRHQERTRLVKLGPDSYTWNMDKSFDGGASWQADFWSNTTTRSDVPAKTVIAFSAPQMDQLAFLLGEFDWIPGDESALLMPGRSPDDARPGRRGFLSSRRVMAGKAIETMWGCVGEDGQRVPQGLTVWGFDARAGRYRMLSYDRGLGSLTLYSGDFDGECLAPEGRSYGTEERYAERLHVIPDGEGGFSWTCSRAVAAGADWIEDQQSSEAVPK